MWLRKECIFTWFIFFISIERLQFTGGVFITPSPLSYKSDDHLRDDDDNLDDDDSMSGEKQEYIIQVGKYHFF